MGEKRFSHEVVSVEYLPTDNPKRFSHEVVSVEYLPTDNPKRFSHEVVSVEMEMELFPIFGRARDGRSATAFIPAVFGYPYREDHQQVDIVPDGLFVNGVAPQPDWDSAPANAVFTEIYAVISGTFYTFSTGNGNYGAVIVPASDSVFDGLEFLYIHITPSVAYGATVNAGDRVATILSYTLDPEEGDRTHLHFGVRNREGGCPPNCAYEDPRPYLVNGLIESH